MGSGNGQRDAGKKVSFVGLLGLSVKMIAAFAGCLMGGVATIPLFFDRIYRILRIFCFHFHFPEENENTKSLREVAWTSCVLVRK